jgi:ppGpp synthetase/RelA/SpoT-type nucleotidyltranferase
LDEHKPTLPVAEAPADDENQVLYSKARHLATFAVKEIEDRIQRALRALGDPCLVRATFESPRIKSYDRLVEKAIRHGWTIEKAIRTAQDFIGFRVVCNNLQDVKRATDLLRESLARDGYKVSRVDDYIAKPKNDGYRTVHMMFSVPIRIGKDEAALNCELQLRSRLQHTWAQLSREDLYASHDTIPVSASRDMRRLAELLAKADKVADRIRDRIARPRKGRRPSSGQTISDASLAFLYRRAFHQDPPEYVIQNVLREYGHLAIRSDGIAAALTDTTFINDLKNAYSTTTRFHWDAEPEQIFRWVAFSVVAGTKSAIALASRDARQEANEIERMGRQEALSGFPRSAKALLRALDAPDDDGDLDGDVEQWASGLGVLRSCDRCGGNIVNPEEFAGAALKQLKARGQKAEQLREELEMRIRNSAVDTGGWYFPRLCSYCDHVLTKDD